MPTFTDLQLEHALHLLKYSNGLDAKIQKLLLEMERDVSERLAARLVTIKQRGSDLGPTVTARLQKAKDEIASLNAGVYSKIGKTLNSELTALASDEIKYTEKALTASGIKAQAVVASPTLLRSIVAQRPINGATLDAHVRGMAQGNIDRINAQINVGMGLGESTDQIVKRVVNDGIDISKKSARRVVRTTVTHISTQAAMEGFKANPSVKEWEFLATLDSRTSLTCASNDGQTFPLGQGPIPPLHPNCRSTITPVTQGQQRAKTRASVDGQVKDSNFETWLKNQGEDRQNQILGVTRAKLWRDGKYSLNDFIRNNREVISLDELRATHPVVAKSEKVSSPVTKPKAFSPRDPNVTDAAIKVESRLKIQKDLRGAIEKAAAENPFPIPDFKGGKNIGKVNFSAAFDNETVSMINAILPEINAITDQFKIPRLRGLATTGGPSASMGDGVLSINPAIFNGYASKIGNAAKVDLTAMKAEIDAARKTYTDAVEKMNAAITGGDYADYKSKQSVVNSIAKDFDRLRKKYNKAVRANAIKEHIAEKPVSAWTIGDDLKNRPHGSDDYFEGMDKARAVMYHETAHSVHQEKFRTGSRLKVGIPPIEKELQALFTQKMRDKSFAATVPTRYALTNSKEWFAESFALYMLGKKDLVDHDLIKLIERLMNE